MSGFSANKSIMGLLFLISCYIVVEVEEAAPEDVVVEEAAPGIEGNSPL